MLLLIGLTIATVCIVFVLVFLALTLAQKGIIVCYPETNKWLIVVIGKKFFSAIQEDFSFFATTETVTDEKGKQKTVTTTRTEKIPMWERYLLYEPFGMRYTGHPFASIGQSALYYPPQIRSTIPGVHTNGNIVKSFDVTHTYEVYLPEIDFQTGAPIDVYLSLEILTTRPDIAWGKYGRFLDSMGLALQQRVEQVARKVDVVALLGQTQSGTIDVAKFTDILKSSTDFPDQVHRECMGLNDNASQTSEGVPTGEPVPIDDMSGCQIKNVTFIDISITNTESLRRQHAMELLAEAKIDVQKSEYERQIAKNKAEGEAAFTEQERISEARGAAALLAALGNNPTLMGLQINANAFADGMKGNKTATTIFVYPPGGSAGGNKGKMPVQPVYSVGGVTPASPVQPAQAPAGQVSQKRSARKRPPRS